MIKNDSAAANSESAMSAAYSRAAELKTASAEVKRTKPSVVSDRVLVGLNAPIDVNFDRSRGANRTKNRAVNTTRRTVVADTEQNEKKNEKTLIAVIALMTMFLFLLAGISIKYTNSEISSSIAALIGLNKQTEAQAVSASVVASEVVATDDALGSLSDILSSQIALISSNNPKFIVTADGKKIVPSDTIDGSLTVVDILVDHIVVTSNGANLKIAY